MNRRDVLRVGGFVPAVAVAGCADVADVFFGVDVDIDIDFVADEIFRLVNEERTDRGLQPFEWHDGAAEAASSHARDMAKNDYYDHTALDGTTQEERYAFCNGGENIHTLSVGRYIEEEGEEEPYRIESSEELAQRFVTDWMNSPPHRERGILGPWKGAGPGVATNDDQDAYAVLGFCQG